MRAESNTSVVTWADINVERLLQSKNVAVIFDRLSEDGNIPPDTERQSWLDQILASCKEKFGSHIIKVKLHVLGNTLLIDDKVVPQKWVEHEWLIPHQSFCREPNLQAKMSWSFDPERDGFRVRLLLVNGMLRLQIWRGPWQEGGYERVAWTTVRSFSLMWHGIHLPLWAYGLDYHMGRDNRKDRRAFFRDTSDYRYLLATAWADSRWSAISDRFEKKRDDWMAKHKITIEELGTGGPRTEFTSYECSLSIWDASRVTQMDALTDEESLAP